MTVQDCSTRLTQTEFLTCRDFAEAVGDSEFGYHDWHDLDEDNQCRCAFKEEWSGCELPFIENYGLLRVELCCKCADTIRGMKRYDLRVLSVYVYGYRRASNIGFPTLPTEEHEDTRQRIARSIAKGMLQEAA